MLLSANCPLSPSRSLTRSKASIVDECFTCCIYTPHHTCWIAVCSCENVCCGSRFINCKAPTDIESPLHTNWRSHHIYKCINHFASLGMLMRALCTIISTHVHTAYASNSQLARLTNRFEVNCHVWSWIYIQIELLISIEFFICSHGNFASYFQAIEMG